MKSIRKSAKGFTFVELIVVMAIIAVLTATLVIAVGAFLRDKKYDDANAKAEAVYRALQIKLNQYDAECHKTIDSTGSSVEGIGGIKRTDSDTYIYIGNFENTVKGEARLGICRHVKDSSGTEISLDSSASDSRGGVIDFDMHDAVNSIYTKRNNANITHNPSWMAKVNVSTYTVEYVLYSEDDIQLHQKFLDKTGSDNDGYYTDVYQQQNNTERARLEYNVVGCYPMQNFYN
ncbi:MAG: Tfp pilus assembly protein FimT/FimU [Oscillospiraceae bacterium]